MKMARTVIVAEHGVSAREVACGRRQVEPDDGDYGPGHQRRHETVDPADAGEMHDQADNGVDNSGGDDAAEGERKAVSGAAGRGARRHRGHGADEGEARAEVARHGAADEGEED